jgi:hypothetical protein
MNEVKLTRRTVLKLGSALLGGTAGGQLLASRVLGAPGTKEQECAARLGYLFYDCH